MNIKSVLAAVAAVFFTGCATVTTDGKPMMYLEDGNERVTLTTGQGKCPPGQRVATYTDGKNLVRGCWELVVNGTLVKIDYEDGDSGLIRRTSFKSFEES